MGNSTDKESKASTHNSLRIALIGAEKVGKTSLILRFVFGKFIESPDCPEEGVYAKSRQPPKFGTRDDSTNPIILIDYKKQVEVDGVVKMLEILDTADRSDETAVEVRDHCIKHSQGFLILYDVTNIESFERCVKFHMKILELKDADCVPVLLVATKCDAVDRMVSTGQGQELAKQHGWSFIETSAKDDINISAAFDEIVRQISKHNTNSK